MESNEACAQAPSGRDCAPSTCESCGAAFDCGASLGSCWCFPVELTEAARARLRARFKRCLCRDCLERFAASGVEK